MNRSTNILGFAFLALAVTLAMSITMRNSPAPEKTGSAPGVQDVGTGGARRAATASGRSATSARPAGIRSPSRDPLKVSLAEDWLATLAPDERQRWLGRAGAVEREASKQLEKLTANLDLNSTQRRKLFPALVRAANGYDPAMIVGGAVVPTDSTLTPAEEIHSLLDPDQQTQLEDNEVRRQLWWQDIIQKLETDLTNATGGSPVDGTAPPAVSSPADEERVAPEARDDGNLFDMITPR
jgi:hypothetical protein